MRLALTADWIMPAGGAEQVIGALAETFPDAPLFTTVAALERPAALARTDVHVSRLQWWFRLVGKHQPLLPWMPRAMESFDLGAYDVILSSSHAVGKGILPPPHAVHVCYCHTPMRYAWFMEDAYLRDFHVPFFLRPLARHVMTNLRTWDRTTALRVDQFIANSRTTAARIRAVYGRESIVVHPPVDDRYFETPLRTGSEPSSFLAVGRLVPYKRFDMLIEAANQSGFRLIIVGTGQDEARLKALAGPSVTFAGHVPDDELPALYAAADALLFPQEEDAGIVLLEAQACGTPVIAYGAGGALDLTREGDSSVLFPAQTPTSLLAAIAHFRVRDWDRAAIRRGVEDCRRSAFRERIRALVTDAYTRMQAGSFVRSS